MDGGVMNHKEYAVAREAHVQFNTVGSVLERAGESGERIFRRDCRRTTVADDEWRFVAPACLIFYGLALVNASKYTLTDIRYLGYCEIILGLVNVVFIGYGLYFWAAGFGLLHIVYGTAMWWKYERK